MIEHDTYLCLQRKKIPKTLDKLMRFTVNYQNLNENNYQDKTKALLEQKYKVDFKSDHKSESAHKAELGNEEPSKPTAIVEQFKLNENKLNRSSNENVTLSGMEVNDLKSYIDQDTLAASVAIKLTMNDSASLENQSNKKTNEKDYNGIESPSNVEDDNCNCSETLSRLCQYCVDKESTALEQVNKILGEIDEIEQLYPCVKALAIDYPMYESDQFLSRIKSLYLYQNIIRDIREKIDLLAKLFHIHNREAAGWPNFHEQAQQPTEFFYNTSSDCTPEIFNIANRDTKCYSKPIITTTAPFNKENSKDDSYSGYSYKLNAPAMTPSYVKQVHFNLADDQSSMKTTPSNSNLAANANISCLDSPDAQMHSIINLNGPQSAEEHKANNPFFPRKVSIYRRFVDKSLKHKGE